MFTHITIVITKNTVILIAIINKIAEHYRRIAILEKNKDDWGKGKDMVGDEQVLTYYDMIHYIIIILDKCSINGISYDAKY